MWWMISGKAPASSSPGRLGRRRIYRPQRPGKGSTVVLWWMHGVVVDRLWSCAAAGCSAHCSVVVQGAANRSLPELSEVVCLLGRKPLLLSEPAMVTPAGATYLLGGIAVMVTSPSRLLGKPHVPGPSETADGGALRVAFLLEGISLVDYVVAAHCGLDGGGGVAGWRWCARRNDPGVDSAP